MRRSTTASALLMVSALVSILGLHFLVYEPALESLEDALEEQESVLLEMLDDLEELVELLGDQSESLAELRDLWWELYLGPLSRSTPHMTLFVGTQSPVEHESEPGGGGCWPDPDTLVVGCYIASWGGFGPIINISKGEKLHFSLRGVDIRPDWLDLTVTPLRQSNSGYGFSSEDRLTGMESISEDGGITFYADLEPGVYSLGVTARWRYEVRVPFRWTIRVTP
ncbi:MAG: hypothetical protein ACE5KH_01375 [Candidatus Geothermarchaeales archaeon]